jgi:hypothetical protein
MANPVLVSGGADRYPGVDFNGFHLRDVCRLIEARHALVEHDLEGADPLSLMMPSGAAYTYRFDGRLSVEPGASGATQVLLDPDAFSEFFHELLSISGLVATGRVEVIKGDIGGFRRWEPALRAIYSGRPIYSGSVRVELVDADGRALPLVSAFDFCDFDAKLEEMRAYLRMMGYLHIRRVFAGSEIDAIRARVLDAMAASRPDDGKSWWSVLEDGREVPTRINYLNRFSAFFDELGLDPRVQALGHMADPRHLVCLDRVDGPMVFIKSPGVKTGLANLLWHKDCDLGGHPVMCPLIQLGIQLDEASAGNGQVRFLAGSHRYSNHVLEMGQEGELPVVGLDTEPGDVTLHFGDVLHCTPAPTSAHANRKVLYYKFEKPEMFESIPAGGHYNDLLFRAGKEGRVAYRASTWKSDRQLDGT